MTESRKLSALILLFVLLPLAAGLWRWRSDQMHPGRAPLGAPAAEWLLAEPAERDRVIGPVAAQLEAFRRGDYSRAASYQSTDLRRTLGSVGELRRMIEKQYPMFAHHRRAIFGEVLTHPDGKRAMVPVRLVGTGGVVVEAVYMMVREGKTYRVDGVSGGRAPWAPGSRGQRVLIGAA